MSFRMAPFSPTGNGVTVQMPVVGNKVTTAQFDNLLPGGPVGATGQAQNFNKARCVLVYNAGPDLVFIELCGTQGPQTVVVGTGIPVPPNAPPRVFGLGAATTVAAISATPTGAKLYVTPGEGGV